MNGWINAAQYLTVALASLLVYRLLWLRDRREPVYWVFLAFPVIKLLETLAYLIYSGWGLGHVDYRIVWILSTAILSAFSLWLVYALARAVLAELPGILHFSRILLNTAFPLAILIAFSTARSEYGVTHGAKFSDPLDRLMFIFSVADRGISMASVLLLIAILAFILWFPVKMSRNLAIFCVGFVIYFASKTGLELVNIYAAPSAKTEVILSSCGSLVLILCFLYWTVFVGPKGQTAEVRMGHSWRLGEQERLLAQLESLNGALMRNSQRLQL
jgi:hypothetical protein